MPERVGVCSEQLYFPFVTPPVFGAEGDAVILFHLPGAVKEKLKERARTQRLPVTGLLNGMINSFLQAQTQPQPAKKAGGRGNKTEGPEDTAKNLLREVYPGGVRAITLARQIGNGYTQAQAMRVLDNLSGNTDGREYDFLVFYDEDTKTYSIAKDSEYGIEM